MAIYHDRFIDLQKELRQILLSEQVREMPFYHLGHLSMLFAFSSFSHLSPKALCSCRAISCTHPTPAALLVPLSLCWVFRCASSTSHKVAPFSHAAQAACQKSPPHFLPLSWCFLIGIHQMPT